MNTQEHSTSSATAYRDAFSALAAPENNSHPYEYMRWLREHDPVHRSASGIFLLSRHADIYWVLKATGDAFRGPSAEDLARLFPRAVTSRSLNLLASTLAMKEPPTHTRLRRLISRDFTVRQIDSLRPSIVQVTQTRLDYIASSLEKGHVVNLHEAFSVVLPMLIFAELFGMTQADIFALAVSIRTILEGLNPHASDEQLAASDAASLQVERYFEGLIEKKRRKPQSDLVSVLVSTHDDDADKLSDAELISMLWGMLLGGFTTTAATIDHAILDMLAFPEQRRWLEGDAASVKAFIEEVLRYDAPAMFSSIPRIAQYDITIGDVTIPEGADVRVLLASGNRDSAAFPDPDRFDPSRFHGTAPSMSTDGHVLLSFGHGIHFCLGAQLARVQLAECLPVINARFPHLMLARDPVREPSAFLRTFRSLQVRLDRSGE